MNAALRLGAVWGLALVTLALSIFQIHNDDAGFHVANGQWILEHGAIPLHNPFSFAEDGAEWIQHQWLSATWMASVAESWGGKGLILWKAALVFVTFLVLMWGLQTTHFTMGHGIGHVRHWSECLSLCRAPLFGDHAFPRHYGCSVGSLERSPRQLKWAWLASLATVASIHFHAGGLYCLLIWGAFLADGLFPSNNEGIAEKWKRGKQFIVWFFGVVLATVLTLALFAPSGLQSSPAFGFPIMRIGMNISVNSVLATPCGCLAPVDSHRAQWVRRSMGPADNDPSLRGWSCWDLDSLQ